MSDIGTNKTIAKNTIFLYIRSFLMMAIGLFSSRVILQALGVEDFGLYGAIGSIVAMFTMINGVLSAGTSRFLTFELGKGDMERVRKTFSASFTMHACLAMILFVLMETIGLWFVNNKLNIPEGREFAANVVYQLSIVTCMLSLTQVPYGACIIAHEKMSIYAYVGIAEVTFKLALIFALLYIPFSDNLIAYAIIVALWGIGLQIWYRFYCRKRFPESNLMIVREKSIYKGMLSYSLWDFLGQFCATGIGQGLNLLLNMFFGVTMNAARSVAYQVEGALTQFSSNFLTATQPQIVKSYASGDYDRYYLLLSQTGKYAFYLLYIITFPFFLEAEYILSLWLVDVPEYSTIFLRVIMFTTLFRVIARPLIQAIHATGNVKFLNLSSGLFAVITYLPSVYILFRLDFPYWTMFIVQVISAVISTILEIWSLRRLYKFSILYYVSNIYLHSFWVALVGSIVPSLVHVLLDTSLLCLIIVFCTSFVSLGLAIYYIGLPKNIQEKLILFLNTRIRKLYDYYFKTIH